MKRLLIALAALLCGVVANAQSIQQSGNVTPGHVGGWVTNGIQQDSGPATAPFPTEFGVHKLGGLPLCVVGSNNPPPFANQPYQILCFSASSTGGTITLNSAGGAPSPTFGVNINGNTYPFPGTNISTTVRTITSGTSDGATVADGTILWASPTTGAKTQTLYACTTASKGNRVTIVDAQGSAGAFPITITPAGTDTINNGPTFVINSNFQSVTLGCNGTGGWNVVTNTPPAAVAQVITWQAMRNPLSFGADPTFVNDATSAITNTIAAANSIPGGPQNCINTPATCVPFAQSVWCPAGSQLKLSDQIVFPTGISFLGNNLFNCQLTIIASTSNIQTSGAINMSLNGGATSAASIFMQGMVLNMNKLNGIGFDCMSCQDDSGWQDTFVYQAMTGPCYQMDGTQPGGSVNTFRALAIQCWGSQQKIAGGDGVFFNTGTYPPSLNLIDVLAYSGHLWNNFIHFQNMANVSINNTTVEDSGGTSDGNTSNAITIDGGNVVSTVNNVTDQNIGTLLRIAPTAPASVFATALYRINGTNTVVNAGNCGPIAQTITTGALAAYACGLETDFDVTTQNYWASNWSLTTTNYNLTASNNINLLGSNSVIVQSGAAGITFRLSPTLVAATVGISGWALQALGNFNATTGYFIGGTAGVTCNGTPTASFATSSGIVIHC